MTFPTDKDIEFFSQPGVAEFFGARWEPKEGDFFYEHFVEEIQAATEEEVEYPSELKCNAIWLPRPDQLMEMLEEKGYGLAHLGDERLHPDFEGRKWNPDEPYEALAEKSPGDYTKGIGPTPAIALAKCVMEVTEEASNEE